MTDPSESKARKQLEDTILLEIADRTRRIRELVEEKEALERALRRSREQSDLVRRTDVTRKNSVNRILVEGAILQAIERTKGPADVKKLYAAARFVVPTLRESTFRSYVHRMKMRGHIESPSAGTWRVCETKG